MITYPKLAAAIVELHNSIAGSFAAPQQAKATAETSPLDALKSIERMVDTMRQDAQARTSESDGHRRKALELAEDVIVMHTLLVLSRINKRNDERETMRLHDMYMDALRVAAYDYDEIQTTVVYEQEMPF